MERLLQAIDNKSEEDESRFKIKGLSRLSSDDDVHCYLGIFERLAKLHKKDPFYWTCILEPLLTSKTQQAFYLLSDSDKINVTLVKNAILRAYSLTPEHYRIKFKHGKKKPTETFEEFASNLESNFRRWTDPPEYMLKDEKSWQVIEKVLMDQFLSTIVNENMKHHLTLFHPAFLSLVVPEGAWYLLNQKSWNIQTWHDDRYARCEGLCGKIDSSKLDLTSQ